MYLFDVGNKLCVCAGEGVCLAVITRQSDCQQTGSRYVGICELSRECVKHQILAKPD